MLSSGTKERDSRHGDLLAASASQTPPTSFSVPPPAQQQRVRSVNRPREGAFAGSQLGPAPAQYWGGAGEWRGWVAAERPAQSWGFASEMRAEEATRGGDGGGDPQTLAVPRPPLPGPEDVLPNGEENSRGDRGWTQCPLPHPPRHLSQPSDFQGHFYISPLSPTTVGSTSLKT